MKKKFTMKQLEENSGVTRRNIRYYITKGILPGAFGKGRGSHYTRGHLKMLKGLVGLQARGWTLEQIKSVLTKDNLDDLLREATTTTTTTTHAGFIHVDGPTNPSELSIWFTHWPTKNVQVLIRQDLKPKARRKIAKGLRALASTLEEE